jgi:catechol 2,3-dioxygenase-like lactoylglutathione lyase family enzyme
MVAMVTGAANGIGRAIAQRLRDDGFRVAAADIEPAAATERIAPCPFDVADLDGHDQVLDRVEQDLARSAGLLMAARRHGQIVNITSVHASNGEAAALAYDSAKAGRRHRRDGAGLVRAGISQARPAAVAPPCSAGRDRCHGKPPGVIGQHISHWSAGRRRRRPAHHILKGKSRMPMLHQQEKTGGYLETIVGEPGAYVRTRIELFEYLAPAAGRHAQRPADVGFTHICVACDDLEERLERPVAAGGVPFSGPVTIDTGVSRGGRGLYLRDPDGHVAELFERPRHDAV